MKDYLEHRQCAIKEVPKNELNRLLEGMVDLLGESWLNSTDANPICKLWKRQDFLSTNELLNFAYAIDCIRKIDFQWLKGQIKRVKSKDINNTRGAIFEIMGFSLFCGNNCALQLASEGNPGIDGMLCFNENVKMNISMKSFGASQFEKEFKKEMVKLKDYFVSELKKTKMLTLECMIQFEKYPNKGDLEKVRAAIANGIKQFSPLVIVCKVENIAVIVFGLIRGFKLSNKHKSYIFLALSPLHKNEFKNMTDKLEDACANLIKQKKSEINSEINGIFIHLHETAAINKYREFLEEYLKENKQKPISFIFLYCPSVARNAQDNTSSIKHMISPIITPDYTQWKQRNNVDELLFNLFVGEPVTEKPRQKLMSDNMPDKSWDVEDMYVYQFGEIYEDTDFDNKNSQTGNLSNLAPGIKVNTVFRLSGKEFVCKGKFPEDEHLEIV